MKNFIGESKSNIFKRKFNKKYNLYKDIIIKKLTNLWTAFIWYCDNVNEYFSKRGIITTVILAFIANLIFSDYTTYIVIFAIIICTLCLINKFLNIYKLKIYYSEKLPNVTEELDNIISECIVEYFILNSYEGTKYINSEEETVIKKEISNMVSSRLSEDLINKLSIKYREDSVYTIIAAKINMIVMGYVVQNNGKIDSDKITDNNKISSTIPYIINNQK